MLTFIFFSFAVQFGQFMLCFIFCIDDPEHFILDFAEKIMFGCFYFEIVSFLSDVFCCHDNFYDFAPRKCSFMVQDVMCRFSDGCKVHHVSLILCSLLDYINLWGSSCFFNKRVLLLITLIAYEYVLCTYFIL